MAGKSSLVQTLPNTDGFEGRPGDGGILLRDLPHVISISQRSLDGLLSLGTTPHFHGLHLAPQPSWRSCLTSHSHSMEMGLHLDTVAQATHSPLCRRPAHSAPGLISETCSSEGDAVLFVGFLNPGLLSIATLSCNLNQKP
jgi:hypothetical protein